MDFLNVSAFIVLCAVFSDVGFASGPCALLEPRPDALCIPLSSINKAFRDARQYFGLKHPELFPPHKTIDHLHDVDVLGMTLTLTTKYLAKEFQLTQDQIDNLLPQLDLELTDIWGFCPDQFRPKTCNLHTYREASGICNNFLHPELGSAYTPFKYLIPATRPDGVDYPKDPDGIHLPSARIISSKIHTDQNLHDHAVTVMLIAWGQIIDHDITLTAETKDPFTKKDPDCCKYLYSDKGDKLHHNCFPIQISHDDEFYSGHHHRCMNFARSFSGVRQSCRLGTRTALNSISSFLDANFIYGSGKLNYELRTGKYGMLKSLPNFEKHGLKDLLPLKLENPDEGCIRPNQNIFCFLAGDHRVNEQLVLTVLHTVFMREHNRIAAKLSKLNSHWNDEKIYQETRRIIIGITQHITYEEFLPMVLGKELMKQYKLSINEGHWNGYDSHVDPSASEEFITSAFRFGHSLLPNRIERWSNSHHFIESHELSSQIRQPFDIFKPGHVDTYILGMVNQLAQAMDEGVSEQVTTLLFQKPHQHFGMDLASINIQRGRDHSIAGYTAYRKLCGLSQILYWKDLIGIMKNETITKYKSIYRSPQDIDLWSGGVSETPNQGSLIGPTFGCIIAKQFQDLRFGDRFWYELPDLPSSFSAEQLAEIKKVKLSRILCDNSDSIKSIQVYPMMFPDPYRNPRVPCQGEVLPRLSLSKWKENLQYKQGGHHHKHISINPNENYVTLHPPKYDSMYLVNPNQYPTTNIHNLSYESTSYPEKLYSTTGADFNENHLMEMDKVPTYKQNGNEYANAFEPEETFYNNQFKDDSRHAGPELLEYLEAPPVEIEPYRQDEESIYNPNLEYDQSFKNYPESGLQFPAHNTPNSNQHTEELFFNPQIFQQPPQFRNMQIGNKIHPSRRRQINPLPPSPFPGLGGIFSPNPGYLVKQRFYIPMAAIKG